MGAKVLAISGEGEPLLDQEFRKIVHFAHTIGLTPFIATNGSLLDEDTVAFLVENGAAITISVDTLNQEQYENRCGIKSSFDRLMKNIETVRHLFKSTQTEEAGHTIMRCGIHTIIDSQSEKDIRQLIEFCRNDFHFSIGTVAEGVNNDLKKTSDLSALLSLLGNLSEPLLITKTETGKEVCGFFYYGLSIGFDGQILLDAHATESSGLLGNIRDMSIEDAVKIARTAVHRCVEQMPDTYCIVRSRNYYNILESLKSRGGRK